MADDASVRIVGDLKNVDLFLAIDIILDAQQDEPMSSSSSNEEE